MRHYFFKFLKKSSGLSLVSALIGLSLASGLSVYIMRLNKMQSDSQRKAFQQNTIFSLLQDMEIVLRGPTSCREIFKDKKVNESVDEISLYIKDSSGIPQKAYTLIEKCPIATPAKDCTTKIESGKGGELVIRDLKIKDLNPIIPDGIPDTLNVTVSKVQDVGTGVKEITLPLDIRFFMKSSPHDEIDSCVTEETFILEQMCSIMLGGFFNGNAGDLSCSSLNIQSKFNVTNNGAPVLSGNPVSTDERLAVNIKGDAVVKGSFLAENCAAPPCQKRVKFDGVNGQLEISNFLKVGNMQFRGGSSAITGVGTIYTNTIKATASVEGLSFWHASDKRLKKNIQNIPEDLVARVLKLNPVSFEWKKDRQSKKNLGFIAQDVEKYFPQLVSKHQSTKSVSYNGMIALMMAVIKKQNKQLEEMEKQVEILEERCNIEFRDEK